MWYAVTWLVVAGLLAVWTLGAWALHALAQWLSGLSGAQVTQAAGGAIETARQASGGLQMPEWLAVWLPSGAVESWLALAASLRPWMESVLAHTPALAGWISPVVWLLWGLGALALLLLGAGLSVLVRMTQRRARVTA